MARKKTAAKKKAATTKAVATVEESQLPAAFAEEFGEDAGAGNENVTDRDIAMPFLVVLQPLSPQVDEGGPGFVDGAEEGMILNTATGEHYDNCVMVPVAFSGRWVHWKTRAAGGGIIRTLGPDELPPGVSPGSRESRMQAGDEIEEKGQVVGYTEEYIYTHYHYVLLIERESGAFSQAILGLTSTQLKYSSRLNSELMSLRINTKGGKVNPPRFASMFEVKTKAERNDRGKWYSWVFERTGYLSLGDDFERAIYDEAKTFAELVGSGALQPQDRAEELAKGSGEVDDDGDSPI